ncbi:MAG TPA: AraC family transcriptional regulator [Cytophaga sp.]|jgi:AraC-like DNA-binding protein|nr:AraC family transcriptional regulator [Cytophaga sp.]
MNHLILALKAYKSDVEIHKHSAYQIVFTEDHPFHTNCEGKQHENIFGFVIKPQVAHACQCSNSTLTIINVEPYSVFGKFLSGKFSEKNKAFFFYSQNEINLFFEMSKSNFTIHDLMNRKQDHKPPSIIDERINKIISFINENYTSNTFTIDDLSNLVFLSPSRLSTLFKQQTGSSISKYLLWIRLRNAIYSILTKNEHTLTDIAYENGFYDSSQMNKYMYEMFGISPSRLKKKSDLIQFLN